MILSMCLYCKIITLCQCLRYLGPNTGNMHIVADLYAEVVGVVAQSRYFMQINVYAFISCIHVKCLHVYKGADFNCYKLQFTITA